MSSETTPNYSRFEEWLKTELHPTVCEYDVLIDQSWWYKKIYATARIWAETDATMAHAEPVYGTRPQSILRKRATWLEAIKAEVATRVEAFHAFIEQETRETGREANQ